MIRSDPAAVPQPETRAKKNGMPKMIFRHPGCLRETLWAFRPTLADGLVLSCINGAVRLWMVRAGIMSRASWQYIN
jgi:hypothetical protein